MLSIKKVLVPIVFTDTSRHVVHQVAWLARRFHAETMLLHVVPPLSYPAGVLESGHEITARDLHAHVVQQAEQDLDQAMRPELDGLAVTRVLLRGDPANEIVKTARDRNVDLIVMSTHGYGAFYRFLLGSVTAKVLHESHCPVWTGAHLERTPDPNFSVRHVLCSVDLSPRSRHTASLAAEMAVAADARLTLVHITSQRGGLGPRRTPCRSRVEGDDSRIRHERNRPASAGLGTKAEVIIDSGNVPELLNRAAEQTKADLLVLGHSPGRSHLGDNGEGYGIIRESHIPVLSV